MIVKSKYLFLSSNNQKTNTTPSVNQGSSLITSTVTTSPDLSKTLTLKVITTTTTTIPYRGTIDPQKLVIPEIPDSEVWNPNGPD